MQDPAADGRPTPVANQPDADPSDTASVTRKPLPKPRHRLGRSTIALLAVPVVAATFVGFFGDLWWVIDLASHFRVQYAMLLGLVVVLSLLLRWPFMLIVSGAALATNLALIVPFYTGDTGEHDPQARPLKVMAFNVLRTNDDHDAVILHLLDQQPDLALMQEVNFQWIGAFQNKAVGYDRVVARGRSDNWGMLLLMREASADRLRIITARTFETLETEEGKPAIEATLEWDGRALTLLGMHALPPVSAAAADRRDRQLAMAADWVGRQPGPVIVCGDLNATPWSAPMRDLLDRGELVNSMCGFGIQKTWPRGAGLARIPIDHVLHSESIVTLERHVGDVPGSDHHPVTVTLGWSNEVTSSAE